jgi:flavin reductase (DIM6/NTAB) family NADH-FMN oxidoreductase RutF
MKSLHAIPTLAISIAALFLASWIMVVSAGPQSLYVDLGQGSETASAAHHARAAGPHLPAPSLLPGKAE